MLYSILFGPKFGFLCSCLLRYSKMANSVDSNQTASEGAEWSGSLVFAHAILAESLVHKF